VKIKAVALFFWINWSAICVVQHRCAMIAWERVTLIDIFYFLFIFCL
jgi:hypothetical protein